eukprot:3256320-Rhodomonas_salina.2
MFALMIYETVSQVLMFGTCAKLVAFKSSMNVYRSSAIAGASSGHEHKHVSARIKTSARSEILRELTSLDREPAVDGRVLLACEERGGFAGLLAERHHAVRRKELPRGPACSPSPMPLRQVWKRAVCRQRPGSIRGRGSGSDMRGRRRFREADGGQRGVFSARTNG